MQNLVELAQWFWIQRFLNFVYVFSLFYNYIHLENSVAFYLRMLCSKFGWNWHICSVVKYEYVKSLRRLHWQRRRRKQQTAKKLTLSFCLWELNWIVYRYTKNVQAIKKLTCSFLWGFSSHSRFFHLYGDVTITGEGLQILTDARHSWPLSSKGSLT